MSGTEPIDVVVADDHELVRTAIAAQLVGTGRMRCVGEAGTGAEAVELIRRIEPDAALIDVGLPDMEGFDVVQQLADAGVPTRAVLVSSRISGELVERGFAVGAWGYLSKVSSVDLLPEAIDAVLGGARYVDPELAAELDQPLDQLLDPAELRVLEHMAAGRDDAAIARHVELDAADVHAHVAAILDKLRVSTREVAVARAIRRGLAE